MRRRSVSSSRSMTRTALPLREDEAGDERQACRHERQDGEKSQWNEEDRGIWQLCAGLLIAPPAAERRPDKCHDGESEADVSGGHQGRDGKDNARHADEQASE